LSALTAGYAGQKGKNMDEEKARETLCGDGDNIIQDNGGLHSLGWYLNWEAGDSEACLDGQFTADELEAIAWWMRNKS